jgi:hypothetical protein
MAMPAKRLELRLWYPGKHAHLHNDKPLIRICDAVELTVTIVRIYRIYENSTAKQHEANLRPACPTEITVHVVPAPTQIIIHLFHTLEVLDSYFIFRYRQVGLCERATNFPAISAVTKMASALIEQLAVVDGYADRLAKTRSDQFIWEHRLIILVWVACEVWHIWFTKDELSRRGYPLRDMLPISPLT